MGLMRRLALFIFYLFICGCATYSSPSSSEPNAIVRFQSLEGIDGALGTQAVYLIEIDGKPSISIKHDKFILYVRPSTDIDHRQLIFQEWYRDRLKELVPKYIEIWEEKMHVKVSHQDSRLKKVTLSDCSSKTTR